MININSTIDFQSISGRDIFIGMGKVWLYSDTYMIAPLDDIPLWLMEFVA